MDNLIISVVGGLVSFGIGFIGWYIKKLSNDIFGTRSELQNDTEKLRDKLQTFEVEVARNYVTKLEITELKVWLNNEFKELKDLLKNKQDKE